MARPPFIVVRLGAARRDSLRAAFFWVSNPTSAHPFFSYGSDRSAYDFFRSIALSRRAKCALEKRNRAAGHSDHSGPDSVLSAWTLALGLSKRLARLSPGSAGNDLGAAFENRPGVLAHIQDADDLHMRGQHSVTNQRFLNYDSAQVRKNSRFDSVAAPRVFCDGNARSSNLGGDGLFDLAPKLAPKVTTNVSPVFLGQFGESYSQSSRGSVKKSGGQSSSLAPLASLNFFSRAGVAA